MDPITLIALASAAGFVFKRRSGKDSKKHSPFPTLFQRRSTITPGKLSTRGNGIDLDEIEELPEYIFVKKLIDARFPIIFVTGGAGTGKSTFVNWLMHHYQGNVLLSAPTAIAANNIDGKTIHSLFQLPLQWITTSSIKHAPYRMDIKNAKLLIIDEISMVNSNLLDGISGFLRKNRGIDQSFGGLPVVMVGDLFQLPPVVNPGLLPFFERHYEGRIRFYAARSLIDTSITYYAVELNKTFRQSNQVFVDILADIREGKNLENSIRRINSLCSITQNPPTGSVWLAPRRSEVSHINWQKLQDLPGRLYRFEGLIKGNFRNSEDTLPAPFSLEIKKGSQVIFTRNDNHKRWINGTIGTVIEISDHIVVSTFPFGKKVRVNKEKWSNFKYVWDHKSQSIIKQETGTFIQYPLSPAWALTIHKSQGKTLEKVHLDLGKGTFAFGQTYVALSRCRELSGLTLSRPLTIDDVQVDKDSQLFNDHLHDLMQKLPREKMLDALN